MKGSWVGRYLRYGETHTFASGKSKPVPVPKRSTCAARDPWYDLTKLVKPGIAFWPMAHHYRHVIPSNPEGLICNHRMFDLTVRPNTDALVLTAILNSTVVALWKTFYGRYTGTEGSLDTEVIDVRVLEIPDPRRASSKTRVRIIEAFEQLSARPIGRLVEDELMKCRSPEKARVIASGPLTLPDELRQSDRRALDDAVFELLGVPAARDRRHLVDRLYEETASHFRRIRVVEIQKQEQRAKGGPRRFTADELAADAWDAAELSDWRPLQQWLEDELEPTRMIDIPDQGAPALVLASDMYDRKAVYFGEGRNAKRLECDSRGQAEFVNRIASLGLRGSMPVPIAERACRDMLARIDDRLQKSQSVFEALVESRAGDEKTRREVTELLTGR